MPDWAEDDSVDHYGYSNLNLQRSLEDSYGTIVQILNGSVGHPLLELWLDWTSKHGWDSRTHHLAKVDATLNFQAQFHLDILPGDLALIGGFALKLQHDLGPSNFRYLTEVATLLFKVVVMRTYLGRNPCDDEQIFYLAYSPSSFGEKVADRPDNPLLEAKHGSIVRNLTVPERVLLGSKSSHHLCCLVTNDIPLPQDVPLAQVLDALGEPYQFFRTNSGGLFTPGSFVPFRPLKHTQSPDHSTMPAISSTDDPSPSKPFRPLKYTPSPQGHSTNPAIGSMDNPSPSKPRLIMANYQPDYQLPNNTKPAPIVSQPLVTQAKRQRNDDDDYYSTQTAVQFQSMSKKDKRQRNDEDRSVPQRRSSRLNK